MAIHTVQTWRCDGCGATADNKPNWVTVRQDGTYESNVGLLAIGQERQWDFCGKCWQKMRSAVMAASDDGSHGWIG